MGQYSWSIRSSPEGFLCSALSTGGMTSASCAVEGYLASATELILWTLRVLKLRLCKAKLPTLAGMCGRSSEVLMLPFLFDDFDAVKGTSPRNRVNSVPNVSDDQHLRLFVCHLLPWSGLEAHFCVALPTQYGRKPLAAASRGAL